MCPFVFPWPVQMLKDEALVPELLRRLPVIALEDALLPPPLPLAVWLMAAQVRITCSCHHKII